MNSTLYITFLEQEGPYIKIWGQTDKNMPMEIEQSLMQMTPRFELGECTLSPDEFQVGVLCCAKFKDGAYYRARISNTTFVSQGVVEVVFIDYGNKDLVPTLNVRSMNNFVASLIAIPAQAREFILGNITHNGSRWESATFESISNEIRYLDLKFQVIAQCTNTFIIALFDKNDIDIASSLISRRVCSSVPIPIQQMILQNGYGHTRIMAPPSASMQVPHMKMPNIGEPTILNYKSIPLAIGSEHMVYVSYVSEGPCLFSIQLQNMEDKLKQLMTDINAMSLLELDEPPLPGCVCLARSIDDDYICRAVVTSMVDGNFKVFYVDFGNTEVVPFTKLYQIPFKYVMPKVMATRFALYGLNNAVVTIDMKCAFKDFVNNKVLFLRVMPPAPGSALGLCELWDKNNVSALDFVKCVAMHSYPEQMPLARGVNQDVKVSFVSGCVQFYVQLKSKEEELNTLMEKLQPICAVTAPLEKHAIQIGMPCNALYDVDQMFYRAQILEIVSPQQIKVKYVDYGNEEVVDCSHLRAADVDLITVLRPQAIECCLHGYQKMNSEEERDNIFEDLILEKDFSMKIVELQAGKSLVDLYDEERVNVGSLLLTEMAKKKQGQMRTSLILDNGTVVPLPLAANKRNEHSNDREFSNSQQDSWRENKRQQNNEGNGWRENKANRNQTQSNDNTSDWRDNYRSNRNEYPPREERTQKRPETNQNRPNRERNSWESNSPKPYEKKNNDFKRKPRNEDFNNEKNDFNKNRKGDGSERSWSGSDKSNNRFKERRDQKSTNSRQERCATPSWNNEVVNLAPENAAFIESNLVDTTEKISISWFHNPTNFYCQLDRYKSEFSVMMKEIQKVYKKRRSFDARVGASVIALFPSDSALYRGTVLEKNPSAYTVLYVDFGNVSKTKCVYQIENKFMNLPAQANHCAIRDITAKSGKWPDSKSLSCFFEKDHFQCNFVRKDNGIYQVDLACNNDQVRNQLISADIAIDELSKSSIATPEIDLNLLLGQQIRCQLASVNNLGDILLQLQPGIFVNCTMHNLATATQTWEENLIIYIGHFVIIYIDNVLENSIEITVYNEVGIKIQVLEPDKGAFETVVPVCSIPITITTLEGYVLHVTDISIFVMPVGYEPLLTELNELMVAHYDKLKPSQAELYEEAIYAVKGEDGLWFRGKVVSIEDTDVHVQRIDYGDNVIAKTDKFRELDVLFFEPCMLTIEILTENSNALLGHNVKLQLRFGDEGLMGIVESKEADTTKKINSSANETPPIPEPAQTISSAAITVQAPPSPDGGVQVGFSVEISHCDNPGQFYLQLMEAIETIEELQDKLQNEISDFPIIENVTTGILCAALYSVDELWYRAQVLDADSEITTVRFIDYGNTDVLDANCKIKTLPPELLALEHHAKRCSLYLKPIDSEWSTEACEKFEEMLSKGKKYNAEIIHQDEKTSYVELYIDGVNVSEILIKENLATELQLEISTSCTGYVSHLNSPSEFWIQLESACGDLEWIAEQLFMAESYPQLEEFAPGSLCAAIFADDDSWYRARILSNTVAGLEVLFIDYGNSCTCSSLRELPEDLIMLPPLAQKSSLQKPPGLLQWPPKATNIFRDISADGVTIFNVNKVSQSETSLVQLLLDNQCISALLLPETFDGTILKCSNINDFVVQKLSATESLGTIEEQMQTANEWAEVGEGDVLVAVLHEDVWCRGNLLSKIDDKYEVFLMDYGDIIVSESVKKLDEKLAAEETITIHCRLALLPGYTWGEQTEQLFLAMQQNGSAVFQVEIVTPNVVNLYLNEVDIRLNLGLLKCTPVSSVHSTPKRSCDSNKKTDTISLDINESPIVIPSNSNINNIDVTMKSIQNSKIITTNEAICEQNSKDEEEVLEVEVIESESIETSQHDSHVDVSDEIDASKVDFMLSQKMEDLIIAAPSDKKDDVIELVFCDKNETAISSDSKEESEIFSAGKEETEVSTVSKEAEYFSDSKEEIEFSLISTETEVSSESKEIEFSLIGKDTEFESKKKIEFSSTIKEVSEDSSGSKKETEFSLMREDADVGSDSKEKVTFSSEEVVAEVSSGSKDETKFSSESTEENEFSLISKDTQIDSESKEKNEVSSEIKKSTEFSSGSNDVKDKKIEFSSKIKEETKNKKAKELSESIAPVTPSAKELVTEVFTSKKEEIAEIGEKEIDSEVLIADTNRVVENRNLPSLYQVKDDIIPISDKSDTNIKETASEKLIEPEPIAAIIDDDSIYKDVEEDSLTELENEKTSIDEAKESNIKEHSVLNNGDAVGDVNNIEKENAIA